MNFKTKKFDKLTNLPVLVMIISVPSSLNLSHRSLVSRWQMTCLSSSQFERSWSRGFIGEGALPLLLPASSVSGSSSVSTSCDVGVGAAADDGALVTPDTLASLSEINNNDCVSYEHINTLITHRQLEKMYGRAFFKKTLLDHMSRALVVKNDFSFSFIFVEIIFQTGNRFRVSTSFREISFK